MDNICPICNGLIDLTIACPECGQQMVDNGNVDSYLGPYSPYQDQGLLEMNNQIEQEGPDPCVHLLTCEQCRVDKRYLVSRVEI